MGGMGVVDEDENLEPDHDPPGTCDWGFCDLEATAWRWSSKHGWLPVCADHVDGPGPDGKH